MAIVDLSMSSFVSCAGLGRVDRNARVCHRLELSNERMPIAYSAEASKCNGHLAYNFNPPLYRLTKIVSNQALRLSQSNIGQDLRLHLRIRMLRPPALLSM